MPYPANPNYGSGVFRRRISLIRQFNEVSVDLEDCNHAFRLWIKHDGSTVVEVKALALRFPISTCPGATQGLNRFSGAPMTAGQDVLREIGQPRKQCTHLYDMFCLGVAHAQRTATRRIYDVAIPDFSHDQTIASVFCDDRPVHQWCISKDRIIGPAPLTAKPLFHGFSTWAQQLFAGDSLEAASILRMGIFVARGRLYDIDAIAGTRIEPTRIPLGSCFSYQPERLVNATRMAGSTRDFTATPSLLLQFK